MNESANILLAKLRSTMVAYGSMIVAFSGGVDSAVVLAVAKQVLGERALGVIGNSPAYPKSELDNALALAEEFDLPARVIETREYLDPQYLANAGDRCFHCRAHLFAALTQLAETQGYACVADGVHLDDLHDHEGGMKAARKFGVRSPLLESGLGKQAVRAIAQQLKLPVWDKPAMACLASRVPAGTPIDISLLAKIGAAEKTLRDLGFTDFRVRHHGELARIEMSSGEMLRAMELREPIIQGVRAAGYRYVTLDLEARQRMARAFILRESLAQA